MKDIGFVKSLAKKIWELRGKKDYQTEENWMLAENLAVNFDECLDECAAVSGNRIFETECAVNYWRLTAEERGNVISLLFNRIPFFGILVWFFTSRKELDEILVQLEDYRNDSIPEEE